MRHAVVAGAGIFGLASALELRARGWDVTVVEPGPIPTPSASSTDRSKAVRMDYGRDSEMSTLAQQALAGWEVWNRTLFPRPLFHRTGLLLLSRDPLDGHGFEGASLHSLRTRGVAVETLSPQALRERFPAWNADLYPGAYLSPTAGWAESGAVVEALSHTLARQGVTFLADRVASLPERGRPVDGVVTQGGVRIGADAVVVACGAWTPAVLPELDGELTPNAMPVVFLRPADPGPFRPEVFPVFNADIARTGWYGFPVGEDGIVKIGHHGDGVSGDPDAPPTLPPGWEDQVRAFLRESLPALASAPLMGSRMCFYCDAADGDFWVAQVPRTPGLVVAAGGSGHGFKFGPVVGALVADAVEGVPNPRLERFRWRPGTPSRTEHARHRGR